VKLILNGYSSCSGKILFVLIKQQKTFSTSFKQLKINDFYIIISNTVLSKEWKNERRISSNTLSALRDNQCSTVKKLTILKRGLDC
jgi:hypothetical protein